MGCKLGRILGVVYEGRILENAVKMQVYGGRILEYTGVVYWGIHRVYTVWHKFDFCLFQYLICVYWSIYIQLDLRHEETFQSARGRSHRGRQSKS